MSRKSKKRQWPNVYEREHRSGEASFVVDLGLVHGKRERHSFKDKVSADTFAEQKKVERQNEGTSALGLSQATCSDAANSNELSR